MAKIVLIGANHAGIAAANTILDQYADQQLVIFERNTNISYLGCGTALWIGGQIEEPAGLFYTNQGELEEKGAKVYNETEVERIDFEAKKIYANDRSGNQIVEDYDKLILATGSLPIQPKVPGAELDYIQPVKLFQDGQLGNARLDEDRVQNVAIIGAGYIGVELAEAVTRRGKRAMLFDVEDTSLAGYYDPWFTRDMDRVLSENGVELHYQEAVKELAGDAEGRVAGVVTDKGTYQAELVFMAVGFKPNNALGKDSLKLFSNGAYLVNRKQETSIPDVYAVGDCATVYSNAVEDRAYIALATNAVRSGIVAGHNVCGTPLETIGVQGSNGICIFDYKMVSTGLNLRAAKKAGYEPVFTDFEDLQRPGFMKDNAEVKIRIIYDKATRRVLGAQMASYEDISMGIHMFSLAVEEGITIDKMKLLDIFFLPHFNQPYNYITMAALQAE